MAPKRTTEAYYSAKKMIADCRLKLLTKRPAVTSGEHWLHFHLVHMQEGHVHAAVDRLLYSPLTWSQCSYSHNNTSLAAREKPAVKVSAMRSYTLLTE